MQRIISTSIAILFLVLTPALAADLPDAAKTPGAILDTVPDEASASCLSGIVGATVNAGDTITMEMVCTPKYTTCIRNVPTPVKNAVYASYGLSANHTGYCTGSQGCEVDHLISLELGGSNDQKNLWPQPYQGTTWNAHVKDQLENVLHKKVCNGDVPLEDAQKAISSNWIDAYKKYIGNK